MGDSHLICESRSFCCVLSVATAKQRRCLKGILKDGWVIAAVTKGLPHFETAPVRKLEYETRLIWLRNPLRYGCTRSVPEWSFSVRRYGFLFQVWL